MSWRRRSGLLLALALLGLALGVALVVRHGSSEEPPGPEAPAEVPAPAARRAPSRAWVDRGPSATAAPEKGVPASRAGAQARLARAQEKLEHYRAATRYPPTSRPASEHPDRLRLHPDAERTRSLDPDGSTLLTVGQDRTFVTAEETARLWVRCQSESGARVPCDVSRGQVSVVNDGSAPPSDLRAPLVFRDDGQGGDLAADDGTSTALLQPKALGMGQVEGTLRVDLEVTDHRETAHPFFTLVTTGGVPARFTGAVSEELVGGSLRLGVGLEVQRAGRYVIHGRVDDARGQPLAWLEFNDELPAGARQAPLVVFGKLIRDQHPAFPLTLRDLDGFLLLEDAYPDRKVVTSLEGPVHRTALYREEQFSDAEWTSEERTRYLDRFQKDVDDAERQAP